MLISFKNVTKAFGQKVVLENVSFEFRKGEIIFILGRSGMGKSVTLKQMIGLLKPDKGSIQVGPFSVEKLNERELNPVRSLCGMVFQHPALLDSLSIYENIAFGLRNVSSQKRRWSEKEIEERVFECLRLVHLSEDIALRMPPEISYGMQKRVSLARTLAPGPEILLFDEPTTGLDPITTHIINDLIENLSHQLTTTSVVVSHDMGCALDIADRILVLDEGKVLAFESVEQIKKNPSLLIQNFLAEVLS